MTYSLSKTGLINIERFLKVYYRTQFDWEIYWSSLDLFVSKFSILVARVFSRILKWLKGINYGKKVLYGKCNMGIEVFNG
jgi:hypothetical protein